MGFFKFIKEVDENNVENNIQNQAQAQTAKVFGGVSLDGTPTSTVTETNTTIGGIEQASTTGEEKKWQVTGEGKNLPTEISVWSKIKGVLFKEIDNNKEIVLELTPREEKFIKGMKDFWLQEVTFSGIKNFFKGKNK